MGRSIIKVSMARDTTWAARTESPTQLEEVVLDADLVQPQDLRPDPGEQPLHLVTWGHERCRQQRACAAGLRQRRAVQLATDGQGQRLQLHEGRGHHVVGQRLGDTGAQHPDAGSRVVSRHDVRYQALAAVDLDVSQDHGRAHPVQ